MDRFTALGGNCSEAENRVKNVSGFFAAVFCGI
jgi:hypothetical protein